MPNTSFFFLWALFAGVAVVILAFAGKAAKKGPTGALIDERNRYSLNRFQLLMWTVLILSAFTAFFLTQGLKIPTISAELLGLIGISAVSATTAGAVKSSKDLQAEGARLRRHGAETLMQEGRLESSPEMQVAAMRLAAEPEAPKIPTAPVPRFSQVLLEEEGDNADLVVSPTKFQNLILTVVAGVALIVMIASQKTLDLTLSEQFLWLLGISHASYVGGKIPNKK